MKPGAFSLGLIFLIGLIACGGQVQPDQRPPTFTPTAVGYVANVKSNSISSFLLDEATGELTNASTASTGSFPGFPIITPDRRFLFVSNVQDGTISRFALDGNGGMQSAGPAVRLKSSPSWLTVAPSGMFLYVGTTANLEILAIDTTTGDLTPTSDSPFSLESPASNLALTHSGRYLYVTSSSSDAIYVCAVDDTTGALTRTDTVHTGFSNGALTVDPLDKFLLVNASQVGKLLVFGIQTSGALQELAGSRPESGYLAQSLAISPNGRFIYMDDPFWRGTSNVGDNGILGYSLDTQSGTVTPLTGSPFADNQTPSSVAVSPTGSILVVSRINPGHVASYRIDSQSGALSPISGTLSSSGIPTGNSPNHILLVKK